MAFPPSMNRLRDGRKIWLVQADDKDGKGWHWDEMLPGEPFTDDVGDYTWGGEEWITSAASRARIRDEFAPGDLVVCYQAVPTKAVLGFARVSEGGFKRGDDEVPCTFGLDWLQRTPEVPWSRISADPLLRESEKVKVKVGTVFRVSPAQLQRVIDLIPCRPSQRRELLASLEVGSLPSGSPPSVGGDLDEEVGAFEGEMRTLFVAHRKRERSLREKKLQDVLDRLNRLRCEVKACRFDFLTAYGPLGHGFAHVHHLKPLSAAQGVTRTSLADLAVVCANCHAMIHRHGQTRSLEEVSRMIQRARRAAV